MDMFFTYSDGVVALSESEKLFSLDLQPLAEMVKPARGKYAFFSIDFSRVPTGLPQRITDDN